MADNAEEPQRARRTFKKYQYRGVELDALLDLKPEQFSELVHARARRRFQRGLGAKHHRFLKKLIKAKKEALPNEKPATVKTHLRNMIIVPEMIGSVVGIVRLPASTSPSPAADSILSAQYNGKTFNAVEIKPEMTGFYLAEFSISYRPIMHGRPGLGATSARFIPLK
ncbi:ribosomal protein S15 [Cystobasidiomycetes sp. EMM_F5]